MDVDFLTAMKRLTAVLLVCAISSVRGQYMSPYQSSGIGSGWLNQPWRSPAWMQTSQLNSMTYPAWRTHPLFRMTGVGDKVLGLNIPHDVTDIPKIPNPQEVLTHLALNNPNPKPLYDTLVDVLSEPAKTRQAMVAPAYLPGMTVMRANVPEDCGPEGVKWERGMIDWMI